MLDIARVYQDYFKFFEMSSAAYPPHEHFEATTLMLCLFFGVNAIMCGMFQIVKYVGGGYEVVESKKLSKELSKPFTGTLDCFTKLTNELFRLGIIISLTYITENYWIFDHSGKEYSRDVFIFILVIFFAYAIYTIKPITDLSLLGREQTEEWKGWMQFIFLLYHYFHAEEVYNSVRVMITCYVWMTGFGNFSFFYMKGDYGWLRVAQMLWRLNFAVLLLMWVHGNTYILYYICPLHTFYFLMVYIAMYVFLGINHTKWGIRLKIFVLGIIIFVIWDIDMGIFDFLFGFLGTSPVIGAKGGTVWEWYFRSSLDHWSTFLGMIFALNFPVAEQFFRTATEGSLIVGAAILGGASIVWFYYLYMQEKMEYNLYHSYFAIIPLLSYIYFRNITPYVRSYVSMSLHELGKTTLETYLLQHHLWLTSNAKTLLTYVPGNPLLNFAIATVLFFLFAKELYRLTMSLRGMIVPDDGQIAVRNLSGTAILLAVLFGVALLTQYLHLNFMEFVTGILIMFMVIMFLVNRFFKFESQVYQLVYGRTMAAVALVTLCFLTLQVVFGLQAAAAQPSIQLNSIGAIPTNAVSSACFDAISEGYWSIFDCSTSPATTGAQDKPISAVSSNLLDRTPPTPFAMCQVDRWTWGQAVSSLACPVQKGNLR